jgi:aminoglycoside phosphotransferase (APT) family kinase protein
MGVTGPAASGGGRVAWEALPEHVRAAVEAWLGSPVVAATTQPGGFSPGVASRLVAADGRRVFVKAVCATPNRDSPRFHRREIRIARALPASAPVPRLLWSLDEGGDGWVVLAFEDVEGQHPTLPWRPDELGRVLAAMEALSESLTPSPVPEEVADSVVSWLNRHGRGWNRLLEDPLPGLDEWTLRHMLDLAKLEGKAPDAARGQTLLHFDTRADNLLLTSDRVYVVDWPHARLGQAWVDLVLFAPSVSMQGGPDPEELLSWHAAARAAAPEAISAVIAAVAGYFTNQSLQPPAPGIPGVRQFQAAQGAVARRWLADRTGWL